jgi:diguanylate cyclase (GGDEF)-like protein
MLLRARTVVITAAIVLLAHVAVVATFGTATPGPLLSDLIQLCLGGLLIFHCQQASRRSEGLARSFWRLAAVAFVFWFAAQSLGTYGDAYTAPSTVDWSSNLLFSFWFVPLAMALFLDPDREGEGLDLLIALDVMQAALVCMAAYLYFFYLPKSEAATELAHSVWTPYFVGYGLVAGAFVLRSISTRSRVARALFGGLGIFLACSEIIDALYFYGPGRGLKTGSWFDILWSILLIVPMVIAATWRQPATPDSSMGAGKREKRIHTEIFYLFYPLLILLMSLRIARERLGLAAAVIFLSFVCSSARLLVTQHRLVKAQEALRWEASRDGLTGLWNRKAVLEILERELLRSERHGVPVGVIMADVDHFKAINDSRGHAAGDRVLGIIASEIAAVVRPYDSVGRYGGEEFLIVAPGCGAQETWELAERICSYVANCSIVAGNASLNVSLSLGIASGSSASDAEMLLHAADTALYQAKNAGRNRVEPSVGRSPKTDGNLSPATNRTFWL